MSAGQTRPKIFGVLMTRDEVDLLRVHIVHHLQTSCDRILVLDNGSTDGSKTVLKRLAKKLPIDWTENAGPLNQSEVVTGLAHEARGKGADWVIPLDTDEFWHAARPLHGLVAEAGDAGAIQVPRIEFVQARDQQRSSSRGVLRMNQRIERPVRGVEAIDDFIAGKRSMFETEPTPKLMTRTTPELLIHRGAHEADGLAGPVSVAQDLVIFHAPMRSRELLMRRVGQGRLAHKSSGNKYEGVQDRYWERARIEGKLDAGWKAHSYDDGALDVEGRRVELVEDNRMAELLSPWVRDRRSELAARFSGRSW